MQLQEFHARKIESKNFQEIPGKEISNMAIPGKSIFGNTMLCRNNPGQAILGKAIPGKKYQAIPGNAI